MDYVSKNQAMMADVEYTLATKIDFYVVQHFMKDGNIIRDSLHCNRKAKNPRLIFKDNASGPVTTELVYITPLPNHHGLLLEIYDDANGLVVGKLLQREIVDVKSAVDAVLA